MAAADPDRYLVVDADGTDGEVAERIRAAVRAVFVGRLASLAPHEEPATQPSTLPLEAPAESRVEAT
jgi:dTMP kinase